MNISANTQTQVTAKGKEVIDKNNVRRIEVDQLVTKIRIGDGNIRLKAPPQHTLTGKRSLLFIVKTYCIIALVKNV